MEDVEEIVGVVLVVLVLVLDLVGFVERLGGGMVGELAVAWA